MGKTRTCPACGEDVPVAANMCKYCNERLEKSITDDKATASSESESGEPLRWYSNKAITIMLLFICFPVGLYTMWVGKHFSKRTRIIISVILAIIVLYRPGGDKSKTPTTTARPSNSTTSIRQPEIPAEGSLPKGFSKKTYDAIRVGMSEEDIKEMLGNPKSVSESNIPGIGTAKVWHYQKGGLIRKKRAITVFFQNGRVSDKNWTEL